MKMISKNTRVIVGDLHGQVNVLRDLLLRFSDAAEIIVAGDFGLGFSEELDRKYTEIAAEIIEKEFPTVSFIRGNHDNPQACKQWDKEGIFWLPDGLLENHTLFIGGAKSHDINHRREGVDWWPDEELTADQFEEIFENLKGREGRVWRIVSHDAPKSIKDYLKQRNFQHYADTTTSDMMEVLLGMLPNLKTWIHGHYHTYHHTHINGVRFIGLAPAHNAPLTSVQINYSMHTFFDDDGQAEAPF
jgi:hypothetical protein